jgi:hypothetical protein
VRQSEDTQDLAIYADGAFAIIDETEVSAQELIDSGVVQLFAFGPALVETARLPFHPAMKFPARRRAIPYG